MLDMVNIVKANKSNPAATSPAATSPRTKKVSLSEGEDDASTGHDF